MDRERFRRRQGATIDGATGETLGATDPTQAAVVARVAREPTAGDVKAQGVRLMDIFVFGPLMLYAGLDKEPPKWVKIGMLIIGGGTIIYNLVNYLDVARRNVSVEGLTGMSVGPIDRARAEALKRALKGGSN